MTLRIYADTLSPGITDTIRITGATFEAGTTVRFLMRRAQSAELTVDHEAVILDELPVVDALRVRYDWASADLADPGDYSFWWRITLPSSRVQDTPERALRVDAHGPELVVGWAPTVDEVATVTPEYTRQGFDEDEVQAGAPQGTFTELTRPTADEVAGMIRGAVAEIIGRVGTEIPPRCFNLARVCAVWHVAAQVAATRMPGGIDEADGEYRGHITSYRATLDELVAQARQPWALRIA